MITFSESKRVREGERERERERQRKSNSPKAKESERKMNPTKLINSLKVDTYKLQWKRPKSLPGS